MVPKYRTIRAWLREDGYVLIRQRGSHERYVQPYSRMVFEALADLDMPVIHFGTDTGTLLEAMRDAGGPRGRQR